MKVLFITGSLESGKDGVGDYTLMIAAQCMAAQTSCRILAINDVYLKEDSLQSIVNNIPVSRLKSGLSWSLKKTLSDRFINEFDTDLVSIQMVGYAYQPRGWIFGLGKNIKNLFKKNVRFEVNLHEVWLGFSLNHDLRAKINGFIQRYALLDFLNYIKPGKIHVSNNVYYSLMQKHGYQVHYLPLPSNINLKPEPDFDWIFSEISLKKEDRPQVLVALFFGSIQGNWELKPFWDKMLSASKRKKLYVLSVGKQGFGNVIWDEMEACYQHIITFKKLGFKTNSEISDLLQFSDFGIGTTPLSLTGKSGTAMAMIEHGLPVVVTRDELKYNFPIQNIEESYPQLILWNNVQSLAHLTKSKKEPDRPARIAKMLIDDLTL